MVNVTFENNETIKKVRGLWQWDYGQMLRVKGLELPSSVEVHFALQETGGTAVVRYGTTTDNIMQTIIPDAMLANQGITEDYKIYVWIYLKDSSSGESAYKIIMNVKSRPQPGNFAGIESDAAILVLDGETDTIIWDVAVSGNAVVTILDRKSLAISNATPGQHLTLQCYGNDIDFSNEIYNVSESMQYVFVDTNQHWMYDLYYNGSTFDVTGLPFEGGTYNE